MVVVQCLQWMPRHHQNVRAVSMVCWAVEGDRWRGLDERGVHRATPTLRLEAQRTHEWPVLIRETVDIRGEECKVGSVGDVDLKPLPVGEAAVPGSD